jgi:DNA polymerase III delta prime subunit
MLRRFKDGLTYQHLYRLGGFIFALILGIMWLVGRSIPIPGIENQHEPLLFVIGIIGSIIILLLTILFPARTGDRLVFTSSISADQPIPEDTRRKNRRDMLELVEKIWITGFLDNVLNQMTALNLDMEFAEPNKVLQRQGLEDYSLPSTAAIYQVYKDLNRRLVILGEPGSGKTVLLLQLARELIAEARTESRKSIPVIFALSSWAAEQLPFEDWLRKELRTTYNLSPVVADDLVGGEQLCYLLDGLDEVAEEHREACLDAIKTFVERERPVDYVLCCRRKEFHDLTIHLAIPGEIIIQPLETPQIVEYLRGEDFVALRVVMAESSIIREDFARIPFMLNTMAVVTRGLPERNLRLAVADYGDAATLRDYFLEAYINRRLGEIPNTQYSDFRQTRSYLKWLATGLVKHEQTDFYIENLQPIWLKSDKQRQQYRWVFGLVVGLLVGLVFGLVFGLLVGLLFGLLVGLLYGLLVGLLFGGIAVIQHMTLRYFLIRDGFIPLWRYDRFLDYAAELVILRKVGGGYRFVHDYLRQYLASAAFVPDTIHSSAAESSSDEGGVVTA